MSYYTLEQIEKAKSIDLLTYLKQCEPDELVYLGSEYYTTKTHDSLRINNGLWNWFSEEIGGYNAMKYLTEIRGYSFIEAMDMLTNNMKVGVNFNTEAKQKINRKSIVLPIKADDNNKIIYYLISRGIDEEIINYCIEKELIYQEKDSNNVVFIGYDKNRKPHYVGLRGILDKRFVGEAKGSRKEYSFRLESAIKNDTVHIFESAIDVLSYATILKEKNRNWREENLLSLAGVYQTQNVIEKSKIPKTIEVFLSQNQDIKCIILHLDRDVAGRKSTLALQTVLPKKYNVIDSPPIVGKDVNDYLKLMKKYQINKDK